MLLKIRLRKVWDILYQGVEAFIEDDALSRGAAIAFYMMTAFAPVLYVTAAIAGLAFGRDAATSALTAEIGRLIGNDGARLLRVAIHNSQSMGAGLWPNVIGVGLLLVTASGMFGEMQSALNAIWKTDASRFSWRRLLMARLTSLGLVMALGFMLLISLVLTAAINATGDRIGHYLHLPIGGALAWTLNLVLSFVLISLLFAAIYKALPDRNLHWHDVIAGAIGTAVLFMGGEYLIGLYLGSGSIGSRYGEAGGLFVLLMWIYYTTQIFLLGAEFTKVWSSRHGSPAAAKVLEASSPHDSRLEASA